MAQTTEEPGALTERVAALDIGKAALTACKWAAVAAMALGDGGLEMHVVDVPLRPALMVRLRELTADFWRRVEANDPYPPDYGRDAATLARVYADDDGRTLDEANDEGDFPRMPVPIPEIQRTAEPGDGTYSTRKVELEQSLLEGPLPATLVRACAIHGPGAQLPRELFFVKRGVDGRRRVALAFNGESRFHTTSVANLAELIRLAAACR